MREYKRDKKGKKGKHHVKVSLFNVETAVR